MNPLTVQNPHYKCDLGNKYDSITDKMVIFHCNNNCYNYYTKIILYLCVCVCITIYTPSPTSIRSAVLKSRLEIRKQFCGFNHVDEMKRVELEIDSHG